MDRVGVSPSLAMRILNDHLGDLELHHTSGDNTIVIPYEGFKMKFASKSADDMRTFLVAIPNNKIRDNHQRGVAAAYFCKVNFQIRNGSFQLDLRDGEALYYSALPLENMTLADCNGLIRSWFDIFHATFLHHFPAIEEIREGGDLGDAERAAERQAEAKRSSSATTRALIGLLRSM